MSALLRFIPAIVFALVGAGLQLGGYQSAWWGNALLVAAAVLAVVGVTSVWLQQYIELRAARASLRQEFSGVPQETAQLQKRIEEITAERDALQEEKRRDLQEQRRKRIEEWRSAIRGHKFGDYPRFASTVAYSQMRPYLQTEVIEMLEAPRTFHIGNEARGELAYEYTLLDEVARIEKEWGLV